MVQINSRFTKMKKKQFYASSVKWNYEIIKTKDIKVSIDIEFEWYNCTHVSIFFSQKKKKKSVLFPITLSGSL